jgi:hypothetical protein
MSTYAELRDTVAAYMHRDTSAFIVNGRDMLLRAINNAKNYCQRAVDFEQARVFAQILNVDPSTGALLSAATPFGGGNAITLKSIEKTFMDKTDGSGQFPVDFLTRNTYVERLRRAYEEAAKREDATNLTPTETTLTIGVVQYGPRVYPVPGTLSVLGGATVNLYFDAIQWLSDFATTALTGTTTGTTASKLVDSGATFVTAGVAIGDTVSNTTDGTSGLIMAVDSETQLTVNADIFVSGEDYSIATVDGTQTNFLLDFAFDFMTFRTIYELNFFLKEDQRVALSDKLLTDAWNNVIRWNATIIGNSVDDATLD